MHPPIPPLYPGPKGDFTESIGVSLPALLAYPSILRQLEWSAEQLGVTFQDIINEIIVKYNACDDTLENCLNALNVEYAAKYTQCNICVNDIFQDLAGAIRGQANTLLSGIQSTLDSCETDIETALGQLQPDQILEVPNPTLPIPDKWPYSFSYQDWASHATAKYYLRPDGTIYDGIRIDHNYYLSGNCGTTNRPTDDNASSIALNGPAFCGSSPAGPGPVIISVVLANCNTTISPTPVPVGNTGPIPVAPIPVSPIPTNPPPPLVSGTPNQPPSPGNQACATPCPIPITIVCVQTTPPTINISSNQLQSPGNASVVGSVLGSTNLASETGATGKQSTVVWEPPVTDIVEQYLDVLGFPQDFIERFGTRVKADIAQEADPHDILEPIV